MRTAFETLGVSVDATDAEIRAAWMAKIQQAHPDVAGSGYEAEAATINAAYQAIRSAEARRAYRNSPSRRPSANSRGGTCTGCGSSGLSDADLHYHTLLHAAERRQNACQVCTREPAADVRYTGVTGFILGLQHWEIGARLCRDCGVGFFRAAQTRLLLTGWWSLLAFISTPFLLLANLDRRMRHAHDLAPPDPREPRRSRLLRGKPVFARPSVLILLAIFVAMNVGIAISASSDAYSSGSPWNSPNTTATSDGYVQSLDIGDCFDDWDGATDGTEIQVITDIPIVDCSQPHDNEIYMLESLPDGEYPGDGDMRETAIGICYEGFEDFVGTSYAVSELDLGWLAPSAASWAEGDRGVVCFVYDLELAKLTGTMADAGI